MHNIELQDKRKAPFVWLHLEALDFLKQHPPSVDRIYLHIIRRAGHNGKCWQSVESMADDCNLSTGSTKRALAILLSQGMIRRDSRKGKTSIYLIQDPEHWIEGGSKTAQVGGSKTAQVGGSNLTHKLDPSELDLKELKDQRERSNAHEPKISLSPSMQAKGTSKDEEPNPLLIEDPLTTTKVSTDSAAIVQTYTAPEAFNHHQEPVNAQAWLEAFNRNAPTKWPRLSVGFMMAPNTVQAIRGYMAGYASQDEALSYFTGALAYLRVCPDTWWRDRAIQPGTIFNPDKLPLAQFFRTAEDCNVNAAAVAASGLTDKEIQNRAAMEQVLKEKAEKLRAANEYRARIGAPLLESL